MATQQEINTLLELLSTLPNCPITTTETRDLVRTLYRDWETDRKSTRLNSSHSGESRMPSSA